MDNASILIIDNDTSDRDYLAMILNSQGFEVFSAKEAENAVTLLREIKPDLIIIDDTVKELTPLDLSTELETRDLDSFIIVLSKSGDLDSSMTWIMAGALACLQKPVQFDKLKHAISAGLDNKAAFHEIISLNQDLKNANTELRRNQELLISEQTALKEKTEQIRFLYELGTDLSAANNNEDVVMLAMKALNRLVTADLAVAVTAFDPFKEVTFYSNKHLSPDLLQMLVKELGSPLCKNLSSSEVGYNKVGPSFSDQRLDIRPKYNIVLPLVVAGKRYGTVALFFSDDPNFSQDRMLLFENIAIQSAQALLNAHQHQLALYLASCDPLTGINNRRSFEENLQREFSRSMRHKSPLSLIMLDLDFFKSVNDRYGHQAGDEVLRLVAEVITSCVREIDIAGRYGGEEFAIILPDTTHEEAYLLAKRIKSSLDKLEVHVGGVIHKQTVSQGIADMSCSQIKQPADLLFLADKALYQAKKNGRNEIHQATAG